MSQLWFPPGPCDPCQPAPCPPPWPPCPPPTFSPPTPPWYPGANAGVSFGTQFPPNPCRGHFLWDGQALWMWDGVAWQRVGPAAPGSAGIPEAPIDGNLYGRENASWTQIVLPTPQTGMPMGITDGSEAKPGQVGECVTGSQTVSIPAQASESTTTTNTITIIASLTPGDWNIDAMLSIGPLTTQSVPNGGGTRQFTVSAPWASSTQTIGDSYLYLPTYAGSEATLVTIPIIGRINSGASSTVPITYTVQGFLDGGPFSVVARARRMR